MAKFNVLDQESRKAAIRSFYSGENQKRKEEARRRWAIYKDQGKKYVKEALLEQTDYNSVVEMMNRSPNINLVKKIIDKISRVYLYGCQRSIPVVDKEKETVTKKIFEALKAFSGIGPKVNPEEQTAQVQVMAKIFDIDQTMKKANRMTKLQKNAIIKVLPFETEEEGKYSIKMDVLHPGQYDVIEDSDEPTKAEVVILCEGWERKQEHGMIQSSDSKTGAFDTRDFNGRSVPTSHPSIVKDYIPSASKIASEPTTAELEKMRLVWWTDEYNFTTDGNGKIIENSVNGSIDNPLGVLPFVFLNEGQDGCYWAIGGDDLPDTNILVNILMTDVNYIMYLHGTGVFYCIGPNVPEKIRVGANAAIVMKTSAGDSASTQIGFASSNPPIADHLQNIEQLVAVLLSTNNLEPSSVSTRLTAESASSGIHELIKNSEVTTNIEDDQAFYRKAEVDLFRLIAKECNYLTSEKIASEAITLIGPIDPSIRVEVEYKTPKPFSSEKEKLENYKLRKELGLDTLEDLIKYDHPDWTNDQIAEKVQRLKESKEEAPKISNEKGGDNNGMLGNEEKEGEEEVSEEKEVIGKKEK